MERIEIVNELKKYFSVKELVCNHTYGAYGEQAWMFLSTPLLHTLLVIRRDILQVPIHINRNGSYQRGLRCNICPIVFQRTDNRLMYLSAHVTGNAVDFTTDTYSAETCRVIIKNHSVKLPYPIRFEKGVSWVHFDVYDSCNGNQITEFNP